MPVGWVVLVHSPPPRSEMSDSELSERMKQSATAARMLIFPLHSATVSAPKWKRGRAG